MKGYTSPFGFTLINPSILQSNFLEEQINPSTTSSWLLPHSIWFTSVDTFPLRGEPLCVTSPIHTRYNVSVTNKLFHCFFTRGKGQTDSRTGGHRYHLFRRTLKVVVMYVATSSTSRAEYRVRIRLSVGGHLGDCIVGAQYR